MNMISGRITVVGGAHIDRRGRIFGDTVPGASNPGKWFDEAGGGGFNAARDLALIGHDVTMVTVSGGDSAAEMVEKAADEAGVSLSAFTFLDRLTPSYTAILEADGNLVIALADMTLYDFLTPKRLQVRSIRDKLATSDLVICDANLPPETVFSLAGKLAEKGVPLAAIAISPAKVVRLKKSLSALNFLFMNEAEAQALSGESPDKPEDWPAIMRALGLSGGLITRGKNRSVGWTATAAAILSPPPIDIIGDVTGAGDAFAAGALHSWLQGENLPGMMRQGAALARLAVQSPLSVPEAVDPDLLERTMALVPEPQMLA
jgi:pseudouridine kinase